MITTACVTNIPAASLVQCVPSPEQLRLAQHNEADVSPHKALMTASQLGREHASAQIRRLSRSGLRTTYNFALHG
jgi:hypothetical protein